MRRPRAEWEIAVTKLLLKNGDAGAKCLLSSGLIHLEDRSLPHFFYLRSVTRCMGFYVTIFVLINIRDAE